MSTSVRFADLEISVDYSQPATAEEFNKNLFEIVKPGIYSGMEVSVDGDNLVITKGTAFVKNLDSSSTTELSVGVKFTKNDILTGIGGVTEYVTNLKPYVIIRVNWLNQANYYPDIIGVAYADIKANDVVLCKAEYNGTTLTGVDYSLRDTAIVKTLDDRKDNLKVIPTQPISANVTVKAGTAYVAGTYVNLASDTNVALPSVTSGMISLVHIDSSGTIAVTNSSDVGSPTTPTYPAQKLVLAVITRGASRTTVLGSEIENLVIDKVGGLNPANDITFSGINEITNTTDSSSKNTGALTIDGGLGVEKNIYSGGTIRAENFEIDYYDDSLTKSSVSIKKAVLEIGSWDMNATDTISIDISTITDLDQDKIIDAYCVILSDAGDYNYPLNYNDGTDTGGRILLAPYLDEISLVREGSSFFDSASFDDTAINRGWLYITYMV